MHLRFPSRFRAALALSLALLAFGTSPACALERVALQLKWTHAFQFAGYYAAAEKGFYRDVGLDVDIREARPGSDPVRSVVDGQAEYGVGNSSLLLARRSGQPVVALAVVFQHSPLVLLVRASDATQGIHDLVGKRFMIEHQSDELIAYLRQEGISPERITLLPHSFRYQDLVDGKVDAMSAYVTNETYYLDQAGISYHTYTPRAAGIDFYGDNLFTTEREIAQRPDRVRAMREASLRGWQYAMEHPEEIAELIHAKYSQQHPRDFYMAEARRMAPLLRTDLIEVGYMNPGRWRHIADTYADLGLLPRAYPLDGFLYDPSPEPDRTPWYVALAILVLASGAAVFVYRFNRRLSHALTESRTAQEALRVSEERHRLLADHATDVIWTMNLAGQITYVSPSVEKLRGYSCAEVLRQSIDELVTPESAPIALDALARTVAAANAGLPIPEFRGELEQPCKDGSTVWTEVTTAGMKNAAGEFVCILGVTRDISERRQMEAQVRQLAFHDPLTQLPNRRLLDDRLHLAMAAMRRGGGYGALMFIDLDNFKPLNDAHGHEAGDQLLIEAARRLRSCVRELDTVARFGGDEFVVMISSLSAGRTESSRQASQIAEKIRIALAASYALSVPKADGNALAIAHRCTASIGLTLFCGDDACAEDILQRADTAMYQAKVGGRDAVRLAEEADATRQVSDADRMKLLHLVWHADYACGHALIDQQHRKLFEDANAIIAALLADLPNDRMRPLIDTLMNDVAQHSRDEEAVLAEIGFADAAAHARIHGQLLDQAVALAGRYDAGTLALGELLQFLVQDLVARHMLGDDRRFFPLLRGIATGSAAAAG
ncbi:ABC transporter substrate-binding protein [Rhodocyclus tenuis]|uniref:Diguanylate cyclase (GGDEF)-like protein/hemerythrin-like metal-binding protein/PAS domain S-box-containing protein n=1 Tax=Rhodocyclus tenuis TaxID=1066 RepID=A0A840GHW5_RHOTE|nr:ABC transporter substrate-binding protein [Rhodocyclus tenuis]MBB4248072.1 diguanylate cyclase (GGDEF)-like protein/hemerythrin-like metal-binding protein/PAS domain S-box-containing protein [Rhodocyclus tenuis]